MSELRGYYERLLETILSDVDSLLQEQDITKRSPKIILTYLEMANKCEEALIEDPNDDEDDKWWDQLSPKAKGQILKIIEDDRGVTDGA